MRHPLHPAFVHFPVACWSLAVATDFASLWLGETTWGWSGGLLAVGCAMAVFAMLAGMFELSRVPTGAPMRDAWVHMGTMLTAFTFFTARLLLRLDHLQQLAPDTVSLMLDAGGFIALAVGGWFGGHLVYGHGVGRDRPECKLSVTIHGASRPRATTRQPCMPSANQEFYRAEYTVCPNLYL